MAQTELHLLREDLLRQNKKHKTFDDESLLESYLESFRITHKIMSEKVPHLYEKAR